MIQAQTECLYTCAGRELWASWCPSCSTAVWHGSAGGQVTALHSRAHRCTVRAISVRFLSTKPTNKQHYISGKRQKMQDIEIIEFITLFQHSILKTIVVLYKIWTKKCVTNIITVSMIKRKCSLGEHNTSFKSISKSYWPPKIFASSWFICDQFKTVQRATLFHDITVLHGTGSFAEICYLRVLFPATVLIGGWLFRIMGSVVHHRNKIICFILFL